MTTASPMDDWNHALAFGALDIPAGSISGPYGRCDSAAEHCPMGGEPRDFDVPAPGLACINYAMRRFPERLIDGRFRRRWAR
jgi:hypothetical protein